MSEYRTLEYVANPFTQLCVSLAALVRHDDGTVTVVLAPSSPRAEVVGSQREAGFLASLRRDIAALDSFERLPRSFGPQFLLLSPQPIPSDDPVRWVQTHVFRIAA